VQGVDPEAGQECWHHAHVGAARTEWKSRAFEVSDPTGFLLTIFSEASA
jgi:hypothetical protein